MTTDRIQNKYERIVRVNKPISGTRLELSRDASFVEGAQDIFDVLARRSGQLQDNLNETLRHFARSKTMLENAKDKIKEQDRRLKGLEAQTLTDLETGLLNRKSFVKALTREIARTNRGYSQGGLLVVFALENFEKIKKRFGKELASEAAALIGEALEKEIRDMDLAARTDDDEFILLFSDTSMKKALSRLQNMAMRLNRLSINHHSEDIRLSLSLGLKSYQKGDEAAAVFHAASSDLQRNSRFSNTQKTKH